MNISYHLHRVKKNPMFFPVILPHNQADRRYQSQNHASVYLSTGFLDEFGVSYAVSIFTKGCTFKGYTGIFAGLFPSAIAGTYPQFWDETGSDESGKNRYERQLLDKQLKRLGIKVTPSLKYLKIYTADEAAQARKQVPTLQNVPMVAMVFNFVDIVAHSRSESVVLQEMLPDESAYRTFTKSWFMHSPLYDILKALSLQDVVVVVTTDHGSVLGRRSAVALGDRETSTNVRYKCGTNLNCDARQAIRVKNPLDYKLPPGGVNKNYIIAKEDYYFVYPTNFHAYERHYKHSFQHGGISMEEMVLPCVTMKPKR